MGALPGTPLQFRVWVSVILIWGAECSDRRGLGLWQHRGVSFVPTAVPVTLSTSIVSMMMIIAWVPLLMGP